MENIKDVVYQVFEKIVQKRTGPQDKIEEVWLNILKEEERRHLKLRGVKNNILFVDVDSSAGLFQMQTKKGKLLKTLQEQIPEIKSISFNIGKVQ